MSDFVTGIRQALQDIVAPELARVAGRMDALDARMTALEKVVDARLSEMTTKMEAGFTQIIANQNIEASMAKLETVVSTRLAG
jgi:hypothetical protein